LLRALADADPPAEPRAFPRGTLLPDGRLDLCKQQLGPENTGTLARSLAGNRFVRSLLLGADFIGDAGARSVAELIAGDSRIETLFLGCNAISPRGLEALLEAAALGKRTRALWLKRNPLGPEGARLLAAFLRRDTRLTTLDVVATGMGEAGAVLVLEALASANRTLERLYLCANDLGPRAAEAAAELLRSGCPIRALYLSCNRLGDRGAATLAGALGAGALATLGLASNGVRCPGAEALAAHLPGAPLDQLELGHAAATWAHQASPNEIGDRGAAALGGALPRSGLEVLLLGGNRVGSPGGLALLRGLEEAPSLRRLELCRGIPRPIRSRIRAVLAARADSPAPPDELRAIQSVYRTARPPAAAPSPPAETEDVPRPPHRSAPDLEASALDQVTATLAALTANPALFFEDPRYTPVRAAANRLVHSVVEEARRRRGARTAAAQGGPSPRPAQRERDRALTAAAAIRTGRAGPIPEVVPTPAPHYAHARACHICGARFTRRHPFYDALCPDCAAFNHDKRGQTAPLDGQMALVTGGRIKIGYQAALKLLRAGAQVLVTTRFPCDAARRYAGEKDFATFHPRLRIVGIDLRDLRGVERLAASLTASLPRLDILINNAAQTIARPAAAYATLLQGEQAGAAALAPAARALLAPPDVDPAPAPALAALAGLGAEALFPPGALDEDGQPLDLRPANSWGLRIEEIATGELLEAQAVNALAPFLLVRGLLPRMRATAGAARHIVNVSAMEGSFSRPYKSDRHVHTNMAKAALDMLTRTLAESLALDRIYMNSVDPGWVTNEHPLELRRQMRERLDFEPPLDALDGAARVCDPIFVAARGETPVFGRLLKNYRAAPW
jgi:NAD(P)-dependent dehydrogenase (short-subunit alcohol dehydrogenase family)